MSWERPGNINSASLWQLQSDRWLHFEVLCSYFRVGQYAEMCKTNPLTVALGINCTATKFRNIFLIILISKDEIEPSVWGADPKMPHWKSEQSREWTALAVQQHILLWDSVLCIKTEDKVRGALLLPCIWTKSFSQGLQASLRYHCVFEIHLCSSQVWSFCEYKVYGAWMAKVTSYDFKCISSP